MGCRSGDVLGVEGAASVLAGLGLYSLHLCAIYFVVSAAAAGCAGSCTPPLEGACLQGCDGVEAGCMARRWAAVGPSTVVRHLPPQRSSQGAHVASLAARWLLCVVFRRSSMPHQAAVCNLAEVR